MTDRYFVVPRTGSGTDDDPYRPKYVDQLDSWAAQDVDMDGLDFDTGLSGVYFITRAYGSEQDIDRLAGKSDVLTIGDAFSTADAAAAIAIGADWDETLDWTEARETLEVR